MRGDAPRKNNLAMVALAVGDGARALRELSQALESSPDFALGHLTLAAALLGMGERDQAKAALDKAQALDPDLPALALTRAEWLASGGDVEAALVEARRAAKQKPSNPQARLLVGRLLRQAGRYDEMRVEARATLALAPPALRERTAELIKRLLGPTALEAPMDVPDVSADLEPESQATPRLRLGTATDTPGLRLLPDGEGDSPRPGTLRGPSKAPRLRLAEPGSSGLKLSAP
jgi:tetratricopeptide (TPR) repeat protein